MSPRCRPIERVCARCCSQKRGPSSFFERACLYKPEWVWDDWSSLHQLGSAYAKAWAGRFARKQRCRSRARRTSARCGQSWGEGGAALLLLEEVGDGVDDVLHLTALAVGRGVHLLHLPRHRHRPGHASPLPQCPRRVSGREVSADRCPRVRGAAHRAAQRSGPILPRADAHKRAASAERTGQIRFMPLKFMRSFYPQSSPAQPRGLGPGVVLVAIDSPPARIRRLP